MPRLHISDPWSLTARGSDVPTKRMHRNQPFTPIPLIRKPKLLNHCMILVGVIIIKAMIAVTCTAATPHMKN